MTPDDLDDWPNCPTPDCRHKVNLWAGEGVCSPCTVRRIGAFEFERRYQESRDPADGVSWNGKPFVKH